MQKTIKQSKIATWLPVFSGFYNTIWSFDDNILYNINETRQENNLKDIDYDIMDIDYRQYEYDIVQHCIEAIKGALPEYIENIYFQKIQSPEKYNFKNDSVDVIVTPKIENIKKCIYDNIEDFKLYLKNRYTSYDGFISWYSNSFETWESETSEFTEFSENNHYLGSILQFICYSENITEYDIYDIAKSNIYEYDYITNYDKCTTCLICTKCNKLIENDDIIKKAKQYNDMMKTYPEKLYCADCMNSY